MAREQLEPTAVLAALITGNHRHVAARASGDLVASPALATDGPIAVVAVCGAGIADPAGLFSRRDSDVVVVTLSARIETLASAVGPTRLDQFVEGGCSALEIAASGGVPLVVLLSTVAEQGVSVEIVFRALERELFETLGGALARSAPARAAIRAGRLRVVAALVEEPGRRVHWLGEHPELSRLLASGV